MKKIFAALFACAMAFGMGCSVQATDSEPTEDPAVEESEEVGSSAEASCPWLWMCLRGPNATELYGTSTACVQACGNGNCARVNLCY